MTVSFGIMLHANSPFSWSFEPAYHFAYQPTVDIVGDCNLNINWHLSAPLLQMVNWKYPQLIDSILQGIEEGRYELMSSSYAQNVMYATSSWANHHHLVKNKEIVLEILNIEPVGFWNPERVWSDKFAELLLDHDYYYTLIETQILNPENPEAANKVYVRKINGESLYFLPDSQEVLRKFDHAIWTGEIHVLVDYLKYLDETYDNPVVCYAQDIESIGYWQLSDPAITTSQIHENLIKLLAELEKHDFIEIQKFSDIIAFHQPVEIESLPDGQSFWMVESAQTDGYKDYFDYMNNSPEIHYYHELFNSVETRLKSYEERYANEDLFNEALSVYLAHQFEFGCATGSLGTDKTRYLLNVPGNMLLEGVRLSNFLLDAFDPPIYQLRWKYLGNHPVIVFSNEDMYSIWSPYGGRCVLLIDKNKKTVISPNPFFYNIGNSVADLELPSPTFEFPDLGASLIHGGTLMTDSIAVNDIPIGIQSPVTRIFSEHGYHDELGPSLSHNYFDTQIIPFDNLIKFWIRLGPFLLMKEVTLLGTDIRVHYTISTEDDATSLIKLGITNEVSPTPNEIMIGGTNVLDIQLGTTDYSIMNVDSGAGLNIQPSIIPTNTDVIEAIFAKRLTLFFSHKLNRNKPFEVDVKLTLL